MAEKIYPKGIMFFKAREGAPDFVKGTMIVTPKQFVEWAKTMSEHFSEYNGDKQLKFDLLDGNNGIYAALNTFKPNQNQNQSQNTGSSTNSDNDDDLPF
tara:strand:+ start:7489 stop:7785 length:297 start_codon:yes stop_codon:yes gene_type:complete